MPILFDESPAILHHLLTDDDRLFEVWIASQIGA